MRLNFAKLVFSQSCSVFRSVVTRRLPIIALMLSLRSATSPRASTWIERVRSPFVTAVATSAIARTWVVRFAAARASWGRELRGEHVRVGGEVAPRAGGVRNVGVAAEPPFDADLARHARNLI